jgi:choline kinase
LGKAGDKPNALLEMKKKKVLETELKEFIN